MPQPKLHDGTAAKQRAYRERQRQARADERTAKGLPPAPPIATMPGTARWTALLATATTALTTVRDEAQTYHDERTDRWKETDRAEQLTATVEAIEAALDELSSISF